MEKTKILKQLGGILGKIDKRIREAILYLFNLVEDQAKEIDKLKKENQDLKDENNNLKGEQGKPTIRPQTKQDISSEEDRKERKKKNKNHKKKLKQIEIDREVKCEVDKTKIPKDAVFKGYITSEVQDIKITRDNVRFLKERYYSASTGESYLGQVPQGYEGGFGPGIKSLSLSLKNVCNISESKVLDFFKSAKVQVSEGTISNLLIKKKEYFHKEKDELVKEGIKTKKAKQIDDTSARVKGKNYYTHVLCNDYFTAYFTRKRKDRLTVLDIIKYWGDLGYVLNDESYQIMSKLKVGKKYIARLKGKRGVFKEEEIENLIKDFPKQIQTRILEAMAIAEYHQEIGGKVIGVLVCDDAPQFKVLTEMLALCWIHDGRHYKKLSPIIPFHQDQLADFRKQYWEYYRKLKEYKEKPTTETYSNLSLEFDELFSTKTGYEDLDDRIIKTKKKKEELLVVLDRPDTPLHNNASELGARAQVRKRDVSLHTMTPEGTKANDTFLSIVETCKKLGVNIFDYFMDRIQGLNVIPPLHELICQKANLP